MKQSIFILLCGAVSLWTITSCEKKAATGLDRELYEMARDTTGFVWFMHSTALLDKSEGSTHTQPFLRTRFNAIAATKLDSTGKIIPGSTFPVGSLIVKEMYDDVNRLRTYAILYKRPGTVASDERGWIWGAVGASGTAEISALKKGTDCISCHLQPDNIDYMLMNRYYP